MSSPAMTDTNQPTGSKFASLGPLLLARKGTAKPAMRPQLDALPNPAVADLMAMSGDPIDQLSAAQDDLGWNDMGDDEEVGDQDAGDNAPAIIAGETGVSGEAGTEQPEVRRQQEQLVNRIADSNLLAFRASERNNGKAAMGLSGLKRAPRRSATASLAPDDDARRAAFTLRLDAERHLRLRLASTVVGESAQNLVTRALDEFLARMPEIETLAAQVRRPTTKA
jgi:hypothetical protein